MIQGITGATIPHKSQLAACVISQDSTIPRVTRDGHQVVKEILPALGAR
ncbi:MAG: hypothetical protein RLY71_1880 [Pseudomonadota bacterium]|jgi:hypothetical protein